MNVKIKCSRDFHLHFIFNKQKKAALNQLYVIELYILCHYGTHTQKLFTRYKNQKAFLSSWFESALCSPQQIGIRVSFHSPASYTNIKIPMV